MNCVNQLDYCKDTIGLELLLFGGIGLYLLQCEVSIEAKETGARDWAVWHSVELWIIEELMVYNLFSAYEIFLFEVDLSSLYGN